MPRRRQDTRERFHFDIADWSLEYGMHIDPNHRPKDTFRRCWETHAVFVNGPLRSRTHRRVQKVELRVYPTELKVDTWPTTSNGFGSVIRIRGGLLEALVQIPEASFPSVFLGLVAGKIASISFTAEFGDKRRRIQDLYTYREPFNPDEDE